MFGDFWESSSNLLEDLKTFSYISFSVLFSQVIDTCETVTTEYT